MERGKSVMLYKPIRCNPNQMHVIETAHSTIDFYKNFCYNIHMRKGKKMRRINYTVTILGTIEVEDWRDNNEISSLIDEDLEDRGVPFLEIDEIEFDEDS